MSPKNRGTFKPARNTNLPRSLDPVCLAPRVPIPYFCRVLYIDHLNKGFISWIMAASLLINLVQKKMSRKSSKSRKFHILETLTNGRKSQFLLNSRGCAIFGIDKHDSPPPPRMAARYNRHSRPQGPKVATPRFCRGPVLPGFGS